MIVAFWGSEMVSYGIIYDQFGSFLLLLTYGSFVLALYSDQRRQSVADIFKNVLSFPPFLALIVAIALANPLQQQVIAGSLVLITSSLVSVVMIVIGLQLKLKLAPGQILPFCFGLGLKLLIAPFAALFICRLLGLEGDAA